MVLKWIIQRRFHDPFTGGQIASEWVATLHRNQWPDCIGLCKRWKVGLQVPPTNLALERFWGSTITGGNQQSQ